MQAKWKDIYDNNKNWLYLRIDVSQSKPNARIHSGRKHKFKFVVDKQAIFWGVIDFYEGVWFLRNNIFWTPENMFLPPITSKILEHIKHNQNMSSEQFWSRFFTKQLIKSKNSFLNNGIWKVSKATLKHPKHEHWKVYKLKKTFSHDQLTYISWDVHNDSSIIPLKSIPLETDGRLKWWRKQVKEGYCPPILVWYVNCLDSFILIDGHYRLQAHLLENKTPDIFVVNEIEEYTLDLNYESMQNKAQTTVSHIVKNQKNTELDIDLINSILTRAYDDHSYTRSITRAVVKPNFQHHWLKEVKTFRDDPEINQDELKFMIKDTD